MRKQELVHLHALCALVRDRLATHPDVASDAFSGYEDVDVSPTAIYRGKRAHRRAVLALTRDISETLKEVDQPDQLSSVTDGGVDGDAGPAR